MTLVRTLAVSLCAIAVSGQNADGLARRHSATERYDLFRKHLEHRGTAVTNEQFRGISNLEITGFASQTNFNFDSVSIKLAGGKGKDKP